MDPWLHFLKNVSLSRMEREVVKRYEADPEGRAFLPLSDILRAHRFVDESIELLAQGVDRHPKFTVARVVLVRELYHKGLINEAWRLLSESPFTLKDNVLAQKLKLKMASLLGLDNDFRETYQHMQSYQMLDPESRSLGELFEMAGNAKVKVRLLKEFSDRGITPALTDALAALEHPREEARFEEDDVPAQPEIRGFHVIPLDEVFKAANAPATPSASGGIELDSTTLADIYARQGHYSKALSVYRRLLKMAPNNDLVKRKVAELARLDREQKQLDLSIDPALVDRMETVEFIDRQIRFLNELMQRLD